MEMNGVGIERWRQRSIALALMAVLGSVQGVAQPIEESATEKRAKKTVELSTVVVTAGGFDQEVKSAPASISVVTQEELKEKPFRDITDALRDIPGVTITGGGGNSDISIRGMAPSYTLMLIDGKRQNSRATRPNSDGPGIEQGWMPPMSAIERIEVVRGPMSSLYGSDAMGGVINVITKKITDEWGGSVRLESTLQEHAESGNTTTSEVYLNGPIIKDKLGIQLIGRYTGRSEDRFKQGYPEQRLGNFSGKLVYAPIDGHTFEAEYGKGFQKRLAHFGKSAGRSADQHKSKREHQSLRYLGTFGEAKSDLLISREKVNNYTRQMVTDNVEVSGNIVIPLSTHMLTLGGQYRKDKLDDKGNQYKPELSKLSRWEYALFVEDEWWILDNLAITAGLRYDRDENYGSHFNPRLYAVWNVNDQFTVKGGVSTGYSAPALRTVVADWGQVTGHGYSDGVILGNPNLKPEKTVNFEASVNYAPNDLFDASLTGFYTRFRDKIQTQTVCDDPTETNQCIAANGKGFDFIQERMNVDKATLMGIEIAARAQILEMVQLTSSYTWTDTEQKSGPHKGKPLNRIPKHQLNVGLDWQPNERSNLWTKVRYQSEEKQVSRSGKLDRYPSYTMLDVGGSYQFADNNTFYAGIYNLTDKRVKNDVYGRVLDGRRVWVGLNIDF